MKVSLRALSGPLEAHFCLKPIKGQLNELTAKVDSLASYVQGLRGQEPPRSSKKGPNKTPSSPGHSSSSSSKSAKSDRSPNQGGDPGKGGSSPPSSDDPSGSPMAFSVKSVDPDSYQKEKKFMRIKNYDAI